MSGLLPVASGLTALDPTAHAFFRATATTPESVVEPVVFSRICATFHELPLKCSISASLTGAFDARAIAPTAQTSVAELADTPKRSDCAFTRGVGRTSGDHDTPL
jgi:hypothetical protein